MRIAWPPLWPLVWAWKHDRVVTENHYLKSHLVETQRELHKYKLLLADLRNADEQVEAIFERLKARV